jgi:diguanylate cyclase (GGDEF)-like protein
MADSGLTILIADDDDGDRKQLKRALAQSGLAVSCVEAASVEAAVAACDACDFDCAFVDYRMPGKDGLHGVATLHARLPFMSIIMVTGQGSEIVATEAMKLGASDYIPKKFITGKSIKRVVESALEKALLRRTIARQREDLEQFAAGLAENVKTLEVKAHEAKLDFLTGLATRPLFLELASALRVRSANNNLAIATLFIDLDGFKAINDRFGHERGDAVLVKAAQVLRASVRDVDIAGRMGGDEFVVCITASPQTIERTASKVARRIVKKISEIGAGVGCSIGIAIADNKTERDAIESSIRRADEAMYEAKRNGKKQFKMHRLVNA